MSTKASCQEVPENQQHLFAHWETLTEEQRASLVEQIQAIDFVLINRLFADDKVSPDWSEFASRAKSPPAFRLGSTENRFSQAQAIAAGEQALSSGRIGVILVAGGQGSRLGSEDPKGMFPIGPLSGRTLLQMHIDQVRAVARRYDVSIPLYLMTSPVTHEQTAAFLDRNNRFGLPKSDLHFFCQGAMPAVDAKTGKLLLAAPDRLFLSPDGHGGMLEALHKSGCIDDMQQRKIEHLFYFQVDNPLVEICQPEFVGYHLLSNSELSTQVVAKQHPLERVGNVVAIDHELRIIEYSDLPDEYARRRDKNGELLFWAGNTAIHMFSSEFLRRHASRADALPFHRAYKIVPYVNADGQLVTPTSPNANKYEKFIFDLMPLARNPIVVEVDADEVFAPLKNASGEAKDTPETVRCAIAAKHKRMLETVGVAVKSGIRVEINPLFALDSSELKRKISDTLFVSADEYFDA